MAIHQVKYSFVKPTGQNDAVILVPFPLFGSGSLNFHSNTFYFYIQADRSTVEFIDHVRIKRDYIDDDPQNSYPHIEAHATQKVASSASRINGEQMYCTLMFDGLGDDVPIWLIKNYHRSGGNTRQYFHYDIGTDDQDIIKRCQKKLLAVSDDDQQYCQIVASFPQEYKSQCTSTIGIPARPGSVALFTLVVNYVDLFQQSQYSVFPANGIYVGQKITVQLSNQYDINYDIKNNVYRSTFQYLRHDVYLRIKDNPAYEIVQTQTINKAIDFYIPQSWCSAFPDKDECEIEVQVVTWCKNDDGVWQIIGEAKNSSLFKLRIPDTAIPTCSGFTAMVIQPPALEGFSDYLQNQSGVKLEVHDPAGAMGSTIVKYLFSGGGEIIETSNPYCVIDKVTNSGAVEYNVIITDSRGRISKNKLTIQVLSYEPPRLLSYATLRCDQNGNSDPSGMYSAIRAKGQVDSFGGKNTMRMTYSYEAVIKTDASDNRSVQYELEDDSYMIIGGSLDPNKTYYVYFRVYDNFEFFEQRSLLQTQQYTMFFKPNGDVCAFGQIADPDISQCIELSESWTISRGDKDYLKTLNNIQRRVEEQEHNRGIEYGNG